MFSLRATYWKTPVETSNSTVRLVRPCQNIYILFVTEHFKIKIFMEPNPYSKKGYLFYDGDSDDSVFDEEEDPRFDPEERAEEETTIVQESSPKRKRKKTSDTLNIDNQSSGSKPKTVSPKSKKEEKKNLLDDWSKIFVRKDIPTVCWFEGAINVENLSHPLEFFELYWDQSTVQSIIEKSKKSIGDSEVEVSSFFSLFGCHPLYGIR